MVLIKISKVANTDQIQFNYVWCSSYWVHCCISDKFLLQAAYSRAKRIRSVLIIHLTKCKGWWKTMLKDTVLLWFFMWTLLLSLKLMLNDANIKQSVFIVSFWLEKSNRRKNLHEERTKCLSRNQKTYTTRLPN